MHVESRVCLRVKLSLNFPNQIKLESGLTDFNVIPQILNFVNPFSGPQAAACEQADGTIFTGLPQSSEWVRKEYVSELHRPAL